MSALLPLSNSNGAGDGHESAVVRCVQAYWPLGRVALLPVLVAIPMVIYRHDLHSLLDLWYVPLMGIVAAAIPAAGAPVAGGIVFFPILTLNHICPQEAVAFAAATQLVGVGVFTPLNWLATDPTVFDGFYDILNLALVPGIVGITVALIVQASFHVDEKVTQAIFCVFCAFVFAYTQHGLCTDRLQTKQSDNGVAVTASKSEKAPVGEVSKWPAVISRLTPSWGLFVWYSFLFFLASIATGFIGISIEKMTFIVATWGTHGMHVRSAGIISVALVGWLSLIAFVAHAASAQCPAEHGYLGAVPYKYWLVGLPGILLGSMVGRKINQLIGSRNVMQIFCFFLVLEVIESLLKLSGALDGMGPCIPVQACANTPLDVHNGHSFPESTHSYLWHAVPAARHAMQSDVSPAHPLDPVQL